MSYKIDIEARLDESLLHKNNITSCPLSNSVVRYSPEDVDLMLKLKSEGKTYVKIAEIMNITYYGVINRIMTKKVRNQYSHSFYYL